MHILTRRAFIIAVMLAASVVTQAQTATRKEPTSSVTGRVTIGDKAAAGIIVAAEVPYDSPQRRSPTQRAVTDADGRYRIQNLPAGRYNITPVAPSLVVPRESPYGQQGKPLNLNDGEGVDGIDFALTRGAVITGRVVDADGRGVIEERVHLLMVDDTGKQPDRDYYLGQFVSETDDRGVYRLYGLEAGAYVVSAGGRGSTFYASGIYSNDAPTYAPSSTRDMAAEIVVRSGEEASGIDIRYRGEQGHAVSGRVKGALITNAPHVATSITLIRTTSGAVEAVAYSDPRFADRPFAFYGVPDGEYDLTAQMRQYGSSGNKEGAASAPRRVTVKGANVTGIELTLAPLASINGRILLEPSRLEACAGKPQDAATPTATPQVQQPIASQPQPHDARLRESVILIRRDDQDLAKDQTPPPLASNTDAVPDEGGAFTFSNLNAGRYHLEARLAGENWYVRTLTLPAAAPLPAATPRAASSANAKTPSVVSKTATAPVAAESSDAARNTLNIKQGERVGGLTVIIAEGAASLRGRIKPEAEGARLANNLRAYLVPAEREAADDVFHYAETNINPDGTYAFNNIPPGHYYFVTRKRSPSETLAASLRPLLWDTHLRIKLRSAAEAANLLIELHPCQREEKQWQIGSDSNTVIADK